MKIGDTERVEEMTRNDKRQTDLEKKMWEAEKEKVAKRLRKYNEEVETHGEALRTALENMPGAGNKK